MFTQIKLPEAALLARTMKANLVLDDGTICPAKDNEQILDDMILIDNMLSVMRSKALLNRKSGTKKMLDGLLAIATGDTSVIPGTSNNLLMR